MSYETREVVGSENCLFLNVYTIINRNETNNENHPLMPVMVWIHGGSYNTGSAGSDTNGPDYIVEKVYIMDGYFDDRLMVYFCFFVCFDLEYCRILYS